MSLRRPAVPDGPRVEAALSVLGDERNRPLKPR